MFERIYDGPRALARHEKTPFAKEREEYLNHLAQENRRPQTIEAFAGKLVAIANRIDISVGNSIDLEQIELAAADWAAGRRRFKRPSGRDRSRKRFIAVAKDWLRFLGRLQRPEDPIKVFADHLNDFGSFLHDERGLSPITIRTWSGYIRRFLMWYRSQNCEFSEVGIEDIEKYFKLKDLRWSRATAASTVGALRAFFRYAARREWLSAAIAESILGPRIFQHEALPKAPSWNTVQRLIDNAHTDRTGETNRSRKRRTAGTRKGGISSAAYQLAGARAGDILENSSRKPLFPSTSLVNKMPATLGPRSMAGNIRKPVILGKGRWRMRCGAATASALVQEIVNVSTKYATTG